MLTRDEMDEWRDLQDHLAAANRIIAEAVAEGRRLTTEEAGAVSDALNAARAAVAEGETT